MKPKSEYVADTQELGPGIAESPVDEFRVEEGPHAAENTTCFHDAPFRCQRAPLDVMVVRKIGMPGRPEFAIGAIASGSIIVTDSGSASHWIGRDRSFEELVRVERAELERRERAYRSGLPPLRLDKQTVVLVDDGLADRRRGRRCTDPAEST